MKHYSDYFNVAPNYSPVMTREEINKTPETWLDFYPHTEFEDFCATLLAVLETGDKSVWINEFAYTRYAKLAKLARYLTKRSF